MEPHWDQVCASEAEPPFLDRVAQVMDPGGLEEQVEGALQKQAPGWGPGEGPAGEGPAREAPVREAPVREAPVREGRVQDTGGRSPFVDLAVSYDRQGAIRTAHLLGTNVEAGAARVVEELLVSRLRSPGRLLERVDLRVRASLEPAPRLTILPPLRCLPHITHHEHLPPRFLGDAIVTGGGLHFAGRDGLGVSVRLHVSAEGVLERIEFRAGNEGLLGRVEASLAETRFDPALRNGEPVAGTLTLTFRFPS
jgi:hypothetical protein